MKRDILVFAEDWGGHPSSTQHLFKHLSKDRRVIWVNSIGLRRPQFTKRDFMRIIHKCKSIFNSAWLPERLNIIAKNHPPASDKTSSPIHIIEPKVIPWPGNRLARYINQLLLSRQIGRKLAEFDVQEPILWSSLPTAVDYVGCFNECGVIYYCGDDFSALAGVDHKPIELLEKDLSRKAEIILTASMNLREKFKGKNAVCLPHGVDFEKFSTPVEPAQACKGTKPICGFYGSIANWIDVDLLAKTASLMPDWDFMLIGAIQTDISSLQRLKNVKFLPPQPHNLLPSYLQHWDVAVLPFKKNDQIAACNPLKLREYMASGTPIISTYFPALEPYIDHVNIIDDSEGFCAFLKAKLQPNDPKLVERESWAERAKVVENIFRSWD